MYQAIRILALLFTMHLVSGCWSTPQELYPAEEPSTRQPLTLEPPSAPTTPPPVVSQQESALEVVWKIPDEAVDEYVIRYGTRSDIPDKEVRVKASDVKTIDDSRYGKVYHHLLTDAPTNTTVYVSVAAIRGGTESAPSKIFKLSPVAPGKSP